VRFVVIHAVKVGQRVHRQARLVVRFENGYTEEVKVSNLKYESGWF